MSIDNARSFFETLAAHGRIPGLADAVGSWEFDVENAGRWLVSVDHGALRVAEVSAAAGNAKPTVRMHLSEDELVRLVRGDGHENLFMAMIRGAIVAEGELAFAARLQSFLPIPAEWSLAS